MSTAAQTTRRADSTVDGVHGTVFSRMAWRRRHDFQCNLQNDAANSAPRRHAATSFRRATATPRRTHS